MLLLNLLATDVLSLRDLLRIDLSLTMTTHLLFILDLGILIWNSKPLNSKLNLKLYSTKEVVSLNKNSGKMAVTMASTT